MLAHTRNRNTTRQQMVTRTRGAIVRTRGIAHWQTTNHAIDITSHDIREWKKQMLATIHDRVTKGDFGPDCFKGAQVFNCMTKQENDVNRWIVLSWDPFVERWNKLVATATTGGLWSDDDKLAEYNNEHMQLRREFEKMSGRKLTTPLPKQPPPDKGLFDGSGSSIPWTGLLVVGGLIAVASIMRSF